MVVITKVSRQLIYMTWKAKIREGKNKNFWGEECPQSVKESRNLGGEGTPTYKKQGDPTTCTARRTTKTKTHKKKQKKIPKFVGWEGLLRWVKGRLDKRRSHKNTRALSIGAEKKKRKDKNPWVLWGRKEGSRKNATHRKI